MSRLAWFFIGLLILVGSIIFYNKFLHPQNTQPMGNAGNKNVPVNVEVYVVHPQNLENNILASGTLLAFDEVDLHCDVAGKITQLNLNEGESVKKGDLLVKLFDADLQAQLKKLQAQKETADKTEQRLKQLLPINGIGQQDYDNAFTQQKSLQADIDNLNAQIQKTEIRAPFNGVVGLKNVSIGAYLTPTQSVATLQNISQLKMDFTIPEKYASTIRKGDVLKFQVDGSNESFVAKTYAIEPQIDAETRSIKARALVQNVSNALLPGAFAKIDLGLKSIDGALLVPTQSIIPEARFKKIIVVKNGKADFRKVETGVRNESMIQITSGIESGDSIVTTGILYVKPNSVLKIKKSQSN